MGLGNKATEIGSQETRHGKEATVTESENTCTHTGIIIIMINEFRCYEAKIEESENLAVAGS